MKLDTNFSGNWAQLMPTLMLLAYVISGALISSFLWQYYLYQDISRDVPRLKDRVASLHRNLDSLKNSDNSLPQNEQLLSLKQTVQEYNQLFNYEGRSIEYVFNDIETIIPNEVYLRSMVYRRKTGELQLTASSQNEDALADFLRRLEKNENFSSVLLRSQSKEKKIGTDGSILYEIRFLDKKGQDS